MTINRPHFNVNTFILILQENKVSQIVRMFSVFNDEIINPTCLKNSEMNINFVSVYCRLQRVVLWNIETECGTTDSYQEDMLCHILSIGTAWAESYEPKHPKCTFGHCAHRIFRSACAFAQSDQNLHWPHFDSKGCKVSLCGRRRFWSVCADAQADLNLRWAQRSEGTFPDDAVLIVVSGIGSWEIIL